MTTDSTPDYPLPDPACFISSAPPALFKRGCPLSAPDLWGPSLPEAATSPLYLLDTARRSFIPWLLAFGRFSAIRHLSMAPNHTDALVSLCMLPIPVPRIAARQYFLAIHVCRQDVTAVIADRMAGTAIPILGTAVALSAVATCDAYLCTCLGTGPLFVANRSQLPGHRL